MAEAERILFDLYGMRGVVRRLSAERDQNFHVLAEDGLAYVLKVAHPAESAEVSHLQASALEHIARADSGLALPRVLRTRENALVGVFAGADSASRRVRLLTFLPGRLMCEVSATPTLLRNLGKTAGRLDAALGTFRCTPPDPGLLWDFANLARLRPLLDAVAASDMARLVARVLDAFEERVTPNFGRLRRQFVHNDLNPHNVLCGVEDNETVTGILDFGDMTVAPVVGELAVAACYHIASQPDPLEGLAASVQGYADALPLTDLEIDLLPDFIAARLAMTVLITEWRAGRAGADRAYILRNNPAARGGLAILAKIAPDEIRSRLRSAGFREAAK